MILQFIRKPSAVFGFLLALPLALTAQDIPGILQEPDGSGLGRIILIALMLSITLAATLYLLRKSSALRRLMRDIRQEEGKDEDALEKIVSRMSEEEMRAYLDRYRHRKSGGKFQNPATVALLMISAFFMSLDTYAQSTPSRETIFKEGGIIITLFLILTPVIAGIVLMIIKVRQMSQRAQFNRDRMKADAVRKYLDSLPPEQVEEAIRRRQEHLSYKPAPFELSGDLPPADEKGVLKNIDDKANIRFIAEKRRAIDRPRVDPALSKLIIWYLVASAVWLLWGTSVGVYTAIKFVAPDIDQISWLSFGRLRPVHTNAVFWGWTSLAMMGLAYYVVPRVSNAKIFSIKLGWWSFWLVNISVLTGTIALMAGINNAGGEYREYIWPIQALFGIAAVLTLINFFITIGNRRTREIYISNWYIVASFIFVIVITLVAYLPFWQDGLGETISQGYYMHQGVGMWFMMLTLGLIYYFLPQQLNKPIYSYSLGILAFWTQILFYTLIGTHHFIFSPIPWSIQTVAIVASAGMVIPVVAGTTNFLMTFHGSWHKLSGSYTLPFMLLGTIFYFVGSMQGTAEAFRTTNLFWHFTDFTVAHSHMTMYGIIAFFLWGFIYAIVPRISRQEPPQVAVGVHFWLAFLGLMFYSVPLMIGGTMRGLMWIEGKPFIESVVAMAPYWLWRVIGGTLMWISHFIFAYNMYRMIKPVKTININDGAMRTSAAGDHELIDVK